MRPSLIVPNHPPATLAVPPEESLERRILPLYMPATRTQIYLTAEQREQLDRLVKRRGVPLAAVVREAVDRYLADVEPDLDEALSMTFGAMPDLEVPSRDEWDHARAADRQ